MEKLQSATLFKRLLALVYDGFLVLALWFIATGLFVLLYPFTGLPQESINGVSRAHPTYLRGLLLPLLLLLTWGFYAWFWMRGGQTLGMRAWRLQVQHYHGGPVKLWQTVVRFVAAIVSALAFGLGYLLALIEPFQTFHDRVSLTATVQLPKKEKGKTTDNR